MYDTMAQAPVPSVRYHSVKSSWLTAQDLAVFIAGALDAVITMYRSAFDAMDDTIPSLRQKVLLPGPWVQQERPAEVNRLMVEFLAGL